MFSMVEKATGNVIEVKSTTNPVHKSYEWIEFDENTYPIDMSNARSYKYNGSTFNKISEYEGMVVDEVKDALKRDIKLEGYAKIVAVMSHIQQINSHARRLELIEKKMDSTMTTDEQTELDSIKSDWTQIETYRTKSNDLETLIDAKTTVNALETINIKDDSHWNN